MQCNDSFILFLLRELYNNNTRCSTMSYICKVDVTSNNMKHAQIALNAWNYGTVVQEDVEELKLSIANDIVVQVRGEDDGARKRRWRGEEVGQRGTRLPRSRSSWVSPVHSVLGVYARLYVVSL